MTISFVEAQEEGSIWSISVPSAAGREHRGTPGNVAVIGLEEVDMGRSEYSHDCDNWELIRWRGAVASALRGSRGQKALREMLDALDAMPDKRLITEELVSDGEYCALGVLGVCRGVKVADLDPYDYDQVARTFGLAPAMVREIVYENDERYGRFHGETPEERWLRMRNWVASNIRE